MWEHPRWASRFAARLLSERRAAPLALTRERVILAVLLGMQESQPPTSTTTCHTRMAPIRPKRARAAPGRPLGALTLDGHNRTPCLPAGRRPAREMDN